MPWVPGASIHLHTLHIGASAHLHIVATSWIVTAAAACAP
jgi:hypothetical protein